MSPEERQLLTGLFDRTRNAAATPRDPEAEALIADQIRAQPHVPYLLSQAVIIQDQALKAANEKLQALEARVQELEQQQPHSGAAPAGGGFLSGLGSLFGGGAPPPQPPRGPAPSPWQQQQPGYGQPPQGYGQPPQGGYGEQNYPPPGAGAGPWGGAAPGGGGGFLKGALGAAAGVAGGVLLADSVKGLFGGHNNSLGIGSGLGTGTTGGLNPSAGGETVINNYYENSRPDSNTNDDIMRADHADDAAADAADDYDNDDSYDV